MPRINAQLLVYLVVGAVLALVGLNSIHGEKSKSEAVGAGAGRVTPPRPELRRQRRTPASKSAAAVAS
jgi:hypothetical protein